MENSQYRKRIVVTGATSGVGHAMALGLARAGCDLTLVVRNREKGQAVVSELASLGSAADLFIADLSLKAEVVRVAREILEKHPVIDVLINNAGIYLETYQETQEGHEATFSTNHLAYFGLTQRLLPAVEAAQAGRIVCVASDASRSGMINWDDLEMKKRKYRPLFAYATSKLMNIIFVKELARRLKGSKVVVHAFHPGVVRTGFGLNNNSGLNYWFFKLARFMMRSPDNAALTGIHLALSNEAGKCTGKYWKNSRVGRARRITDDPEVGRRLWDDAEAKFVGIN